MKYIRDNTDQQPESTDNRYQKLLDICKNYCRNDYFQRFVYHDRRYYQTESLWWIDCWESIRLNNILHEHGVRDINHYFRTSEGQNFRDRWKKFLDKAIERKYDTTTLPAFSYLESIRLLANIGNEIPTGDLTTFFNKLCETDASNLMVYPRSNEIRTKSISLIDHLTRLYPDTFDFDAEREKLFYILKQLILECGWDRFSHTWSMILLEVMNDELKDIIKAKIPQPNQTDSRWCVGNNFTRKPRYALLVLINNIHIGSKYYEIIEPSRFSYAPAGYISYVFYISRVIDKIIQGFDGIKDIQIKIQEGSINEGYFRDLIKLGLSSALEKDKEIEWVEKEHETPSGRKSDIYVVVKRGINIPIELKILWRFREGYEPIEEVLEQTTDGTFCVLIVINPPSNPMYHDTYQGFEGWKRYVMDHPTYISGTLSGHARFQEEEPIKTTYLVSDHHFGLGERKRNITIQSYYIDLQKFIRSPYLKKI